MSREDINGHAGIVLKPTPARNLHALRFVLRKSLNSRALVMVEAAGVEPSRVIDNT